MQRVGSFGFSASSKCVEPKEEIVESNWNVWFMTCIPFVVIWCFGTEQKREQVLSVMR